MAEPVVQQGRCGSVEWAVCASPYPGERRSGDAFLIEKSGTSVLIAVVDGLGHGEDAADVAERALMALRKTAGQSPVRSLTACHEELRGSRGAVMTVAMVDADRSTVTWLAVGNVEAVVMRHGRNGASRERWSVPLRGGVVGDRLPPLRESTVPMAVGDTMIAATDGMSPAFLDGIDLSPEPQTLTRRLHRGYARGDDDALVLVARRVETVT